MWHPKWVLSGTLWEGSLERTPKGSLKEGMPKPFGDWCSHTSGSEFISNETKYEVGDEF